MTDRKPQQTPGNLGPYHGAMGPHARVHVGIVAVEASLLALFPWLLAIAGLHHVPAAGYLQALPLVWPKLLLLDLLGSVNLVSFWFLYRRLGERIAAGGAEAEFLDNVRYRLVTLVSGLVTLLVCTLIFTELTRR